MTFKHLRPGTKWAAAAALPHWRPLTCFYCRLLPPYQQRGRGASCRYARERSYLVVTVTDATQSSMRACTHTHAGNTCTCMTCIHIHEKREEREFGANFIPSQFCVHTVLCVRKDVYVHIHTRTHSFGVCLRCCHVRVSAMHVYTRMCAYTSCCD